jgi:hypothetical protein
MEEEEKERKKERRKNIAVWEGFSPRLDHLASCAAGRGC